MIFKKILFFSILIFVFTIFGCLFKPNYFPKKDGCFLLYNLNTKKIEKVINEARCRERITPFSTFKIPLALMAFDSGVLTNENEVFKWDGVKDVREVANQDHDAKSWMQNSIVWFSQKLTPMIGEEKLKKYLQDFRYGNMDISGGLTHFWLVKPGENVEGLKISAFEQLEFMKNLWSDQLPVAKRAMQITRELTYLEISDDGTKLYGKTGSGYFFNNLNKRIGWFVGSIKKGKKKYAFVTNFSDLVDSSGKVYAGAEAKDITKRILHDLGIW